MRQYFLSALFLLVTTIGFSQQRMTITGCVQDTAAKKPLPYSLAMVVRLKDSVLVAFTRSDAKGNFTLSNLEIDTLELIISNPLFGDQSFYIIGSSTNTTFHMGNIALPPKNKELKEVIIYAFKDPVYYKGDTLVYSADSFKVKPNATVEDLLKKLPGIKVDQNGKITSQGKAVDQVLVDGDEFFGSDPTVATRNLGANTVESVQVYEKKDETNSSGENLQVMNLKLKEDAKHGYFGKAAAASDFQKFYEGQVMLNKFKGTQKISVFGLGTNTPKSSLGYSDINKYGLDNERDYEFNEDMGYFIRTYNEPEGIPKNLKSGIYYTDRLGKKTKLNLNYTYNSSKTNAVGSSRSQVFLKDSSYSSILESHSIKEMQSHAINMKIIQTLDSLTDLEIEPKLKLNKDYKTNRFITSFFTDEDSLTHQTDVDNAIDLRGYSLNTAARLIRKFKNRDRRLRVNYGYVLNDNTSDGTLKLFDNGVNNQDVNQKKNNDLNSQTHNALVVYTEPLNKKIKLEFEYNANLNRSSQSKATRDFMNGDYSTINPNFTNSFKNQRFYHSAGTRFIYEVKKQTFNVGVRARRVLFENTNLITDKHLSYSVNNLLPSLFYMYKISDRSRINFKYNTSSLQPTIEQLQPISDNTNPNQVIVGNDKLKPTYSHNFSLFYNMYRPISGRGIWLMANFNRTDRAFSNSILYDNEGKTYTQTVNVNGNYSGNVSLSLGLPFFNKMLVFEPNVSMNHSKNSNYIDNQKNITKTTSLNSYSNVTLDLDTLNFRVNYNYTYNIPSSTVNTASNKPYTYQEISGTLFIKLPFKFTVETSGQYIINSKRSNGYNINYVLWNASINKTFLKNENLILSLIGNDLLNQNISTSRTVHDNVITDTKTTIISRYFLIQLVFKFNNNKTKENDEF